MSCRMPECFFKHPNENKNYIVNKLHSFYQHSKILDCFLKSFMLTEAAFIWLKTQQKQ